MLQYPIGAKAYRFMCLARFTKESVRTCKLARGRQGQIENLQEKEQNLPKCRSVLVRRVPWLIRTDIPPMLQYPIGAKAYRFTASLISMFYSPSMAGCLGGLLAMARCFLPGCEKDSAKRV